MEGEDLSLAFSLGARSPSSAWTLCVAYAFYRADAGLGLRAPTGFVQ